MVKYNSNPIIGGMFGLELLATESFPDNKGEGPLFAKPNLTLSTARSAFRLLAELLYPNTVWLPSFLCEAITSAFHQGSFRVRFYGINERLEIENTRWLSEIQKNDIVVFIDYFGFNRWSEWAWQARQQGAWIIEDACQAMLNTEFCRDSHYILFSPRKFVGVPDGGILRAQDGAYLPEVTESAPALWWLEAARASVLRAEYDRYGGERTWFEIFKKTEIEGPYVPCRMSELSLLVLKHTVDWQAVSQGRRNNYQFLASELGNIALFPDLPDHVVPLGFPVVVKQRDRVRQALFARNIFPPVHWPISHIVPPGFEASHQLAASIMTIPCDQRYHIPDMEHIVYQLKQGLER